MQVQIQDILNLLESNNLQEALKLSAELASNQPDDPAAQDLFGLILAKSGKVNLALERFQRALDLDPTQVLYHNHISNTYKLLGNLDLATRHLHEALRCAPNNAETYNNLGSLYYTQGQIQDAIPCFEKAIRLNPNSWEAHYNLANCFIRTDLIFQAIEHYNSVLDLNPNHKNAKVNLAMAYVSLHDYTTALPWLIAAAKDNPQHAELQGHLAEAYLDLGKSAEAINQFNLAISLDPNRAAWYHNLAVLYLRDKQHDLAHKNFALSLKLDPENQTAKHMLTALNKTPVDSKNNMINSAPTEYVVDLFDQYASYYNEHVKSKLKYKVPESLRHAISNILGENAKQQNVLDLGCGTGLCGVYFRDLAGFMIGVDLSPVMLAHAKNLDAYEGLCRCNILQTIPGENMHVFDIVLAADVLVYIGDLQPIFILVKSALRVDGKFAFTVEESNSNSDYELLTTGRFAHKPEYISKLCEYNGFKILTQESIILREQDNKPIQGCLFVAAV